MFNIKVLSKNRVTEENMRSSQATIYASQDRAVFLIMMLANYST